MMQDNELKPTKVLVIDDSAFNRQTIKGILEKAPNVEVVGVAVDGHDGMTKILKLKPDVVTLDIEMPGMDGFALLRWIMEERPLPVIVVSSYGDEPIVFKALELGAVDFVIKPTKRASTELKEIESDLLRKVLGVTSLRMEKLKKTISLLESDKIIDNSHLFEDGGVEIIAMGASTGGPTAIQSILTRLPGNFPGAMVISQHMPRGFTKQFAERISKISSLHVKEAEHGESIEQGKVLICPGGHHIVFEKLKKDVLAITKDSSTNDRYIPSIDIMMKSVAEIYGARTMGILLTGMGNDGREGMLEIKKRGGFTIAESEESSVVFGMPREVISSGCVDKILPLEKIPAEILKKTKKGPSR
jgi:two-component system chemotaxis response regulator CheB